MKKNLRVASLVVAAALIGAIGAGAATAESAEEEFDGYIVRMAGEELRYPRADGWDGLAGDHQFTLTRRAGKLTLYGDFMVEDTKPAKRSDMPKDRADPSSWNLHQGGRFWHFGSDEGWSGGARTNGVYLHRRGQTIWFYGTLRLEET